MANKFCIVTVLMCLLSSCGFADKSEEVNGVLRFGHEVRSFTDQRDGKEYWVIDKSGNLMAEYKKVIGTEVINNQPVQAKLRIKSVKVQPDGFAKGYAGTYEVKEIISLGSR